MKRIMSEKKTTLPSLRNQNWRTLSKPERVNDKYPKNNILDLNDLIYGGAKLL